MIKMLGYIRKVTKIDQFCQQQQPTPSSDGCGCRHLRKQQQNCHQKLPTVSLPDQNSNRIEQQQQRPNKSKKLNLIKLENNLTNNQIDDDILNNSNHLNSCKLRVCRQTNEFSDSSIDYNNESIKSDENICDIRDNLTANCSIKSSPSSFKSVFSNNNNNNNEKRKSFIFTRKININNNSNDYFECLKMDRKSRLSRNNSDDDNDSDDNNTNSNNVMIVPKMLSSYCNRFSNNHSHNNRLLQRQSNVTICPTIASALWRPLWPPGWHPRSNSISSSSSPITSSSSASTAAVTAGKVPNNNNENNENVEQIKQQSQSSSLKMTIDNELKLVKSTTAATTAPTTKLLMKTINNQNNNNQQQQKMDSKKLFKINNDNSTNDNMNSNSNTSNVKTIQSYRRKLSYEQQQTTRKQFFLNGSNNTDEPDDFVRIEDWLDEHPDFVHSYVVRKVSRSVIDKWLIAHSATTIGTLVSSSNNANQSNQSNVSNDSGTNTPVRKISAHEFEASGGGYLRPMVSTTSDGTLTFLPLSSSSKDNLMDSKMIKESNDSNDSANNKQSMQRQSSVISIRQRDQLELLYNRNKQEYERELIFELVKDICNDLDVKSLCHKILKNISILTQADRCSLFLVRGENDGLIENRYLVSQLFDVCGQSTYEQVSKNHEEIIISWGTGIVGHVAETGEAVNIPDCYNDSRFTDMIDQKTGYKTMNMLCNPIFDIDGNVMGVAQVINKINAKCFDQNDENVFAKYLQFCGIGLRNAQIYERSQLENKRNQVLLDLARMVFEKQSNIENIIYRILIHILSLLQCERCQIMLLKYNDDDDNDDFFFTDNSTNLLSTNERQQPQQQQFLQCNSNKSFHSSSSSNDHSPTSDNGSSNENSLNCSESNCISQQPQQQQQTIMMKSTQSFYRVFDLQAKDLDDPDFEKTRKTPFEGRFPLNIGITGYVVTTGETLNIADAYQDNRFDPIVDEEEEDGEEASELIDVDKQNEMNQNEKKPRVKFRHRSILCMPIRNATSKIIGVAQLVNKLNGRPFNRNDENLFEAFAIFSGMGIENTHKFEKAVKSMAKQKVTLELLSYHASASEQEASKFARMLIPSTSSLSLSSLRFDDFSLNEDQMIKACIRMFIDLDFIERFHIDYKVLCKWILSVRKNYRQVLYHNWRHAFNVAQIMFAILVNTDLCYVLGELETMALIVACLCHDLDHRGTNNSFQVKTCSPLAQLYSTSTLEHHHFDQSLMILNSQGNQIFSNLSPKEYHRVVYVLKEAILATDLAVYFSKRDKFFKLVDEMNEDSWSDEQNRSLLRSMLMTCCDISAITKPWNIQKVVAELVASEFYQQGDIEKEQLKIEPSDMMNREKRDELPKMQLSFIDSICLPIYQSFAKLKPMPMEILLNGVLDNRDAWELLSNEPYQLSIRQMDTINNYNSSLTTKTLLQTETTTIAATSSSSSIHDIASNFKNDLNDHEDKDNKRDLDVHIDRDIDSNEQQNHSDDND